MNTLSIVNTRNFDVNRLSFVVGPAKAGRNPTISLKYDGQNFQLRLPSKLSVRLWSRADDTGKTTYTLTANLKGCDPYARDRATGTSDTELLYNALVFDLKKKILDTAEEKSKQWFGKPRARAALEDGFKDMHSVSADKIDGEYVPNGKYAPSFRVKIPVYDGKVVSDVIDSTGNPVYLNPETLDRVFENNIEVNMVVSPSIYVIAGGGFGVTWRLNYAQIFPRARMNAASVFMTEEVEESPAIQDTEEQAPSEAVQALPPADNQATPSQAGARKKRTAAS